MNYDSGVEYSKIAEQMCTIKNAVIGWPSVVSDDLAESFDQEICERQRFTISELSCEFTQISDIALDEIITVRLGDHRFCAGWVLKIVIGVHRT
jgi:hypothetical protein